MEKFNEAVDAYRLARDYYQEIEEGDERGDEAEKEYNEALAALLRIARSL